jgi:isoaspartyl peptidase/L-asparaginase-like protein (Ntn-hydrolase superfamily)
MNEMGGAGSVAFLQHILHPVQVARLVMEHTPHVMLVGEGALRFALEQGFTEIDLLTPQAEAAWREWLKEARYEPVANVENHDTVGCLGLDASGRLAGCCSTSGASFKMHGRVGDSPIIGAALYVDGEVGAACATGLGEEVIKTVGSFLVVELMRQGRSPAEACQHAVERIVARHDDLQDLQVGYLALDRRGRVGACAVQPEFSYAARDGAGNRLHSAPSHVPGPDRS